MQSAVLRNLFPIYVIPLPLSVRNFKHKFSFFRSHIDSLNIQLLSKHVTEDFHIFALNFHT